MKTILLARHGATSSKSGTFCGITDSELSVVGKRQSQQIVNKATALSSELVITTGLQRTDYCGELARQLGIRHATLSDLREIDFGDWEGQTWQQIVSNNQRLAQNWLDNPDTMRFPQGETGNDFRKRVRRAWFSILARPETVIAIITHSGVIGYLSQLTKHSTKPIYLVQGGLLVWQIPTQVDHLSKPN